MGALHGLGLRAEWLDQPRCNHFTAITGFAERESVLCEALAALAEVTTASGDRVAPPAPARDRPRTAQGLPNFRTFGPVD
jgi:hypothetical protein